MRSFRQVLPGLIMGAVSILLILGSFMVSFAEGGIPLATGTAALVGITTMPGEAMNPATKTPWVITPTRTLVTDTPSPVPSVTPTITSTTCPKPPGWLSYLVKTTDTLEGLARRYQVTVDRLLSANCLASEGFTAGISLFVPPLPTKTSIPCGPPSGWVLYPVQPGDTLYRLSVMFGIEVKELQVANCMGTSTLLVVGKWIYVPPWTPILPTVTGTPYQALTPTWTVIIPGS